MAGERTPLLARPPSDEPPMDVAFKGLALHVGGRAVLSGVTGAFSHGRLAGIMGPSGSGKSSFLAALSGRCSYGKRYGEIIINGVEDEITKYKKLVGFVPQDDIMLRELTVYEILWFSTLVRLPVSCTAEEKLQILNHVIRILGLSDILHSRIGDEIKRGISGGQRKRVNIGIELVANPTILFLDEPTSGLDSSSSQEVMHALQVVAHSGITVVAVVHQPRYDIYTMFDDILLLGKGGHTVFMGPSADTLEYFERLGYRCPEHVNPPDFFLDIITGVVSPAAGAGGSETLFAAWDHHASLPARRALVDSHRSIQTAGSLGPGSLPSLRLELFEGFLLAFFLFGLGIMMVEANPNASLHRRYGAVFGAWAAVLLGCLGYVISDIVLFSMYNQAEPLGDTPSTIFIAVLLLFVICSAVFLGFTWIYFRKKRDSLFFVYFTIGFANLGPLGLIYLFAIRRITCLRSRLALLVGFGTQLLVVGISLVFAFYILWIGSPFIDQRCSPDGCNILAYTGAALVFVEIVIVVVFASRYRRLPTHDRATMGFLGQLLLCARRGIIQQARDVAGSLFELGLVALSGLFLGLIYYRTPFLGPAPAAVQHQCPAALAPLCALPMHDPVISEASLLCLALSLAAVTSSQRIFGREKAAFQRESASGISTEAYYIGKSLAHLPFSLLAPLILLALFYPLTDLRGDFLSFYALMVLVHANAAGVAYLMSIVFTDTVAQLGGVLFVLVNMMFSGANPTLQQLREGVMGGMLYYPTFGSFIRWAQENFYLTEMAAFASTTNVADALSTYSYDLDHRTRTWVVLVVYAIVVRVCSYLACVLREP